ncbi:MAG TPA: SDR family NAD(P)-dependent oxidoreductase [Micromonosporaceae bacterium]
MEDLTGSTVVITGASSGIGFAAAQELARRGHRVVLVGRDEVRLERARSRVRAAAAPGAAEPDAYRADFAVLDEVRALAERLRAAYPRIDVLANNAGGVYPRRVTTVDGFDLTIQVNHLAGFLLTNLLRDRVSRVVNTASRAHQQGRLDPDDLSSTRRRYVPLLVYGGAKQANILFAAEAARQWPDVLSTAYHPGTVRTRFGSDSPLIGMYFRTAPWLRSPARGARTLVWLAGAPAGTVVNGGYYVDERLRRPSAHAADPALAARLWEVSERAVGLT